MDINLENIIDIIENILIGNGKIPAAHHLVLGNIKDAVEKTVKTIEVDSPETEFAELHIDDDSDRIDDDSWALREYDDESPRDAESALIIADNRDLHDMAHTGHFKTEHSPQQRTVRTKPQPRGRKQ